MLNQSIEDIFVRRIVHGWAESPFLQLRHPIQPGLYESVTAVTASKLIALRTVSRIGSKPQALAYLSLAALKFATI